MLVISLPLRWSNAMILCMFVVKDVKTLWMMTEEASGRIGPATFLKAYQAVTNGHDHNFLMCNFNPKQKQLARRRNWDEHLLMRTPETSAGTTTAPAQPCKQPCPLPTASCPPGPAFSSTASKVRPTQ